MSQIVVAILAGVCLMAGKLIQIIRGRGGSYRGDSKLSMDLGDPGVT